MAIIYFFLSVSLTFSQTTGEIVASHDISKVYELPQPLSEIREIWKAKIRFMNISIYKGPLVNDPPNVKYRKHRELIELYEIGHKMRLDSTIGKQINVLKKSVSTPEVVHLNCVTYFIKDGNSNWWICDYYGDGDFMKFQFAQNVSFTDGAPILCARENDGVFFGATGKFQFTK